MAASENHNDQKCLSMVQSGTSTSLSKGQFSVECLVRADRRKIGAGGYKKGAQAKCVLELAGKASHHMAKANKKLPRGLKQGKLCSDIKYKCMKELETHMNPFRSKDTSNPIDCWVFITSS